MKKTLSVIMLVAVLASFIMVFPVSAENYDEVYKANVVFDGKLDSAYLKSLACVMKETIWSGYEYIQGDNGREHKGEYFDPNYTATTYFLHDDENLYICAYVQDANIIESPEWPNEGIDIFITLSHGVSYCLGADLFGRHYTKDEHLKHLPEGNLYEDYYEVKSFIGDGYYTIEVCIPKVGINIVRKTGTFKCAVQINDVYKLGENGKATMGAGFDLAHVDSIAALHLSNKKVTGSGVATPDTTTKTPVVTPAETTKAPVVTPEETTKAPVVVPGDDTTIKDDTPVVVPGDDTTAEGDDTTVPDDTTVEGDETIADDTTAAPDDDTTEAEGDDVEDTTKAPDTTKDDDTKEEDPSFPVVPVVIIAVVVVAAVVAGIIIAKKRK